MDKAKITPSMEDYLETILRLQIKHGKARVKDIADMMKVRMSSVNNAVLMIKKQMLVEQQPYGAIEITPEGRKLAAKIFNRHKLLTKFFIALGVPAEVAESDACDAEHVLSEKTFKAIEEYYNKNLNLLEIES